MFTGIIEHKGIVKAIRQLENLVVMTIDLGLLAKSVRLGDSVAINGVCLTATQKKGRVISFDLMKETIETTSLKVLSAHDAVNIELALPANGRLGGHFVTGHVDEVGQIVSIEKEPNWVVLKITLSKKSRKYVVPKGSITIDGISLTVGRVTPMYFSVYIIPFTLKRTNLSSKKPGDLVNIETDILAKYIVKHS